jgi:hypothetical protein
MQIFNQFSAVWIAALLLVIIGIVLLRRKPKWPQWIAFGAVVLGLIVAWILLHPQQTAQGLSADQVQATIGQGTPVLLELKSPY